MPNETLGCEPGCCRDCGQYLTRVPSTFPGWLLLTCQPCNRPIRLLPKPGSRVARQLERRKAKAHIASKRARRLV